MQFYGSFSRIRKRWEKFWMNRAGLDPLGRLAIRLASIFSPPYKGRGYLAHITRNSYISASASIYHNDLQISENVFIGDRVVIYEAKGGGKVRIGKAVDIHSDCIIETGQGGYLSIGEDSHIQARCLFSAYKGTILIGRFAEIAPRCAFYPYDHEFKPGELIKRQSLKTCGGIIIGDDVWLGVGVIVLDGARIGSGAVVGAGSVVKSEIPDQAIATGVPAKVIKYRNK